MSELILHHYDGSPFAEKVRLILGFKGLAWRSVIIPMVMPKPDLMPLTGGYRRTPVLQIGADIYCDTRRIAAELERRQPQPTLFPAGAAGLADMVGGWAERSFFWQAAPYATGMIADKLPAEFHEDRARMRGGAAVDVARIMAAAPRFREPVMAQLAWVESALADGRSFLLGEAASYADFATFHPIWFLRNCGRRVAPALEPFTAVKEWMGRVGAVGHGSRQDFDAAGALVEARESTPDESEPLGSAVAADDVPGPGAAVEVTPDDYARDPVRGELVFHTGEEIAIRRRDDKVGDVIVHFPRVGYMLRAQR